MSSGTLEAPATQAVVHGQGDLSDALGCVADVSVADSAGTLTLIPGTSVLEPLTYRHGRTGTESNLCEPGTLTFLVHDRDGTWADKYLLLRRRVVLQLSASALTYLGIAGPVPLFYGYIAEVGITPADDGVGAVLQILATSDGIGELGRRVVGDAPWPAQPAWSRAVQIATAANMHIQVSSVAGNPNMLARDVDRRTALDLFGELCADTDAVLVDSVANRGVPPNPLHAELTYVVRDYRSQVIYTGPTLLCDWIYSDWTAAFTLSGLVNQWSIGYGPTPEGGEQPRAEYTEPDSVAQYGPVKASPSTGLAALADVNMVQGYRQSQAARAVPIVPDLRFDLWRSCPKSVWHDLMNSPPAGGNVQYQTHQPVTAVWDVKGLPQTIPVNRSGRLRLEGITHTITRAGWEVLASMSDPYAYGSALLWRDINTATRWADVDPALTWADANTWDGTP